MEFWTTKLMQKLSMEDKTIASEERIRTYYIPYCFGGSTQWQVTM
jgi:hypothetical protein